MKYCPKCGSEYFDDAINCHECNETLINEREWKKCVTKRKAEDKEFFVRVKTVEDRFEADIIKDALEKENVPVLVRSFQDTSFDGIFIPQKGWGIILVPEEHRDKAKYIIESLI
jgi:methionyl-tRNA synthetase